MVTTAGFIDALKRGGLEDATKRWEVDLSLSCPPHFASLRAFHIFPRFYDTR
jgi:hypothetical protein